MLNLNVSDPRIIQQQVMSFAFEKYEDLRCNDPVGKDRYETATRIGRLFGIDPSFFIYADDYGLETAVEYFMHLERREDELIRRRLTDAFTDMTEDEKKDH